MNDDLFAPVKDTKTDYVEMINNSNIHIFVTMIEIILYTYENAKKYKEQGQMNVEEGDGQLESDP